MKHKTITVRVLAYLFLAVMAGAVFCYLYGGDESLRQLCLFILIAASWLHGICWGLLLSFEKRLTWF